MRGTRGMAVAMTAAFVCAAVAAPADASSIFVRSKDASDRYASGVQSYITAPPLPQVTVDNQPVYMFVATHMRNGDFYQAGWETHVGGSPCSFNNNAFFAFASHWYDLASPWIWSHVCQASNVPHRFTLQLDTAQLPDGRYGWDAYVDNSYLAGSRINTSHDIGENLPYVQAETGTGNSTQDALGPSRFAPALKTRHDDPGYWATLSAWVWIPDDTLGQCPPYGATLNGYNDVTLGSGQTCGQHGATAW